MDFDQAILSHTKWKMRLLRCIRGMELPPSSVDVGREDVCALGEWLKAESHRYAAFASFHEAVAAHAQFHRCAAQVVLALERGDRAAAEAMLEAGTPYSGASAATIFAIMRLRAELRRFGRVRQHA